ncbi:MAG: HAD family phosphatase [Clostridiales bacterium]|nr:HAD family phosphatase [Clostridiales bacterium]
MNEPRILSSENPVCVYPGMILDLDGTLLDSMEVWGRIDKEFLADYGIDVPPDYMEACGAMSFRETAEYTIARFSLPAKPEELMNRWLDMAREEYAFHVQLLPGARELLEKLHRAGVRLAVATASRREHFLPCLSRHGVLGFFDAVVTTDDAGCGKSSPAIFELAARQLSLPPPGPAAFPSAFTKSIPPEHARRWSLSAAAISKRFLTHAARLCCGKSHKAFA